MIRFHSLVQVAVLLSSLVEGGYTSRMQDRGYNPSPYGEDVDKREEEASPRRYDVGEGRVQGRGFNNEPAEDNVSGIDCMGSNGVYGNIQGNIAPDLVEWKYQVETVPNPNDSIETMIAAIEVRCLDLILPVLFPSMCGSRREERRQSLRRKLLVVGATTNPVDSKLQSQCDAEDPSNGCFQVEGQMNIYTDGKPFDLEKTVLNELERSMKSGEMDTGVHPEITKIRFIDLGFDGLQDGNPSTGQSNSPERRIRAPYFALAAVGGLVLIAAGVIWKRRKDGADAASVLTGDTSTLPAASNTQAAIPATGDLKPVGDSIGVETTMDFSTFQEESILDN